MSCNSSAHCYLSYSATKVVLANPLGNHLKRFCSYSDTISWPDLPSVLLQPCRQTAPGQPACPQPYDKEVLLPSGSRAVGVPVGRGFLCLSV